jgi:hypothetical protein
MAAAKEPAPRGTRFSSAVTPRRRAWRSQGDVGQAGKCKSGKRQSEAAEARRLAFGFSQ